ncbi:hypothetical protein MHK_007346 [Candidatus Magnetomorum sp. HK-1]|nr:hypothetical protein MHK_007346 [Candidatus Magnetomorum sp. HK-1]
MWGKFLILIIGLEKKDILTVNNFPYKKIFLFYRLRLTDASGVAVEDDSSVFTSKDFIIDHPIDPENKILRHATIESLSPKN